MSGSRILRAFGLGAAGAVIASKNPMFLRPCIASYRQEVARIERSQSTKRKQMDDHSRKNESDSEIQEPKSKKAKTSEGDQDDLDEFDSWTCDIELFC
jgi:hypothetical protein